MNGITTRSLCVRFLFVPLATDDVSLFVFSLSTNTLIIFYDLSSFSSLSVPLYLVAFELVWAQKKYWFWPISNWSDPTESIFRHSEGRARAGDRPNTVHHFIKLIHAPPFAWRSRAGKEKCPVHRGLSDSVAYKLTSSSSLYLPVGLLLTQGKYCISSGKKKKKGASLKQMNRSEKGCKDAEKQKKNENLDHMQCLQLFMPYMQ